MLKNYKIRKISFLLFTALFLCSCNTNKFLDRPGDTNLEFWITQRVEDDDFANCTYIPKWFGAREYLDSRYEPIYEDQTPKAPEICVTYVVTGYPDLLDSSTVTTIRITDSNINVYGLTLNSKKEDIEKTMLNNGFNECESYSDSLCYTKNNVLFQFRNYEILLSATPTNNSGIIF